jgi:tape measure domain-containing protein
MTSEIGVILRGNSTHLVTELQKSGAEVDKFGKRAEQSLRGVKDESQSLGSAVSVMGSQLGVAIGAGFAITKILEFRSAMQGAQVDIDKLRNALTYGMGAGAVTQEVDYLRKATNTMGLEFASTSQLYAKFAAAAKGTALEGKGVRDVFEAVGKTTTVMGLGVGEVQGVMLALTQIMSKGTVQAEEIRGQLGERLPGAFAIAARAMGVTTAEFSKMLEMGQVVSTDFLPKFAAQLEKEAAGSFEKAAQSMQSSMNRMGNSWEKLKNVITESGVSKVIANENDGLSSYFNALADSMENAKKSGHGLAATLGVGLSQTVLRVPFDALSLAGNTLNGVINLLSRGVVNLNTNINLLPEALSTNAVQVEALGKKITIADAELRRLQLLDAQPMNGNYYKQAIAETAAYIRELKEARHQKESLQIGFGPGDVSKIAAQYPTRSQSYATESERLAKIKTAMLAVQVTASGVDANFQKHLSALKAGFDEGLMSEERYVSDVAALIQKEGGIRKSAASGVSEASKSQAAAIKADIDGARLMAELKEKFQGEEMKQQEKLREELEKTMEAYAKASEVGVSNAVAAAVAAEAELANYGLLKSAVQELTLVHLEQSRESAAMAGEDVANIEIRIAAQKRLIAATRGLEGRTASDEALKDLTSANQKAAEESGKFWQDSLMRAFESGQGFFESFFSTIKNALKTQVLKVFVQPIAGAISGAMGLSGAANAASGGSSALGALGTGSSIYSAGSMMAGLSAATTEFGVAALATTQSMVGMTGTAAQLSQSMALGTGGSMAGSIGAVAPYALAAIAVLAAVGAFRTTKQTGTGISGTLGDDASLTGFDEMRKSGYLFGGPKYWDEIKAMDPLMAQALKTDFANIKTAATGAAGALGLASDSVAGFNKSFRIEFTGDKAKDEALYTELMAGASEDLARTIIGSYKDAGEYVASEFAKAGETASTTLARLSSSITVTNAWLSMLRNRLFDVSTSGADAASQLADAFGGLDKLAASSAAYYGSFYTESERAARSAEDLAKQMALVNIAMPANKDAFRAVVDGLDLTTDAGRKAYATMLTLAPEFATTTDALDTLATATAEALIKAFSGNGKLTPALNAAELAVGDLTGSTQSMRGELSFINSIMGDSTSKVIGFKNGAYELGTEMSASQKSATQLRVEMDVLGYRADQAVVDIAGLSTALAGVSTATFVATVTAVFETLATRISSVLGDINSERIAVRDAALSIINPTVMSKVQIQRGIAAIGVSMPGNAGVVSANSSLSAADQLKAQKDQALIASTAARAANQSQILSGLTLDGAPTTTKPGETANALWESIIGPAWNQHMAMFGVGWDTGATSADALASQMQRMTAEYSQAVSSKNAPIYQQAANANTYDQAQVAAAQAAANNATAAQTSAATAAKKAALDYTKALQSFAIEAGASVTKLSRLREETAKYYEGQKALADLMTTSATGLRTTVASYRFAQLSEEQQYQSLAGQFSSAYAKSQGAGGETLAGYGDTLNSLLNPLIESLTATGRGGQVGNYLSQAESVAALIEASTPVNYQLDSLKLLGDIDATLASLQDASLSAEKIISDAIRAGSDRTAAGLGAVISALTGQAIPAFAMGGTHSGGIRLVGENGPELEVTGPSRIYSASQTRGMLGGSNTDRLEALVERQSKQLEAMSYELRAIAAATGKTAKTLERVTPDGDSLQMTAVA